MAGLMNRGSRGAKQQVENPGKIFIRLMRYILHQYKFCLLYTSDAADE